MTAIGQVPTNTSSPTTPSSAIGTTAFDRSCPLMSSTRTIFDVRLAAIPSMTIPAACSIPIAPSLNTVAAVTETAADDASPPANAVAYSPKSPRPASAITEPSRIPT